MRALLARWRAEQPELAGKLDGEALEYVDYHTTRYARLLTTVAEVADRARTPDRLQILDMGPNIETALLRATRPGDIVDTLGFAHPAVPPRGHERHITFDLDDAPVPERHPRLERSYDVVVVAEVAEHLHTPLEALLTMLRGWLRAPGFVVIQTPNGAALHKRIALLAGRSPVPPPRRSRENPGHVHEYTLAELRDQVARAGFEIESLSVENHYGDGGPGRRLYRRLGRVLPPTLRHGVTLCVRAGR